MIIASSLRSALQNATLTEPPAEVTAPFWSWQRIPSISEVASGVLAGISYAAIDIPIRLAIRWKIHTIFDRTKLQFQEKALIKSAAALGKVITCIAAPLVEELVFRGLIMNGLHQTLLARNHSRPDIEASVVSAALFGAVHIPNGYNLAAAIQSTLAGISGLAYAYLAYNFGLSAPIAAHMTNNFFFINRLK